MPKLLLPEALFIDRVESPIGTMLVFHDSEERLRALDSHDYEPRMRRLFRLHWGQEGSDFTRGPDHRLDGGFQLHIPTDVRSDACRILTNSRATPCPCTYSEKLGQSEKPLLGRTTR